ncbi:hypothetical protein ACIRBX_26535 [Kitasatospora sp. NPDC096147]|uniref:hypothetical protein n=1 Tax=Kitasatospora sp. NPDC096147 TaxID=3364093 RepID=UPI0037FBDC6B
MSSDQKFEEDLTFAMARVGEAFHTETFRLESAGLARGRRAWRRRQAGRAIGVATALALVSGGAYLFTQPGGPTAPPAPAGGPTPSATAPSGAATPSGSPSATASGPGSGRTSGPVPVPTDRVVAALKSAFPPGTFTDVHGMEEQDMERDGTFVEARFDDGAGAAQIAVEVSRHAQQVQMPTGSQFGCKAAEVDPTAVCRVETLADGSLLRVHQGLEYPDGREKTKYWSAVLAGKDGRLVRIDEWNAPVSKGVPVSRPAPPLTVAQLTAALRSGAWDPVLADLPVVGRGPGGGATATAKGGVTVLPHAMVSSVASGLMPPGLIAVPSAPTGEPLARLTVKGAESSGLLEVTVEDHRADLATYVERYRGGELRSDGSRVLVTVGSGAAPRWVVDLLRADGRRVLMAAYAATGPEVRPGEAMLTSDQLLAIGDASSWAPRD